MQSVIISLSDLHYSMENRQFAVHGKYQVIIKYMYVSYASHVTRVRFTLLTGGRSVLCSRWHC